MAADYEPPSFSLGLDFGFDSELQSPPPPDSPPPPPVTSEPLIEPPRSLKRLKRGPPEKRELPTTPFWSVEDDIEEFSSPEDSSQGVHRSIQYQTSCSSSKVPLRGSGVLTSQSAYCGIGRKTNHVSDVPASVSSEAGRKEFVFPKLTISPLRRFQLIDSDSDDPSVSPSVSRVDFKVGSSSKKQHTDPGHSANVSGTNNDASTSMPIDVDLWKNFSPIKKINIPTPALDEVCQEYFHSVKDNTAPNLERNAYLHTNKTFHEATPSGQDVEHLWNVADHPLPPAHHYFFHDDPKIRNLVCCRLLNFSPLGAVSISGNQQNGASVIDYMGQFSNGEASNQNVNRRQNSSNKSNVEVLDGSENWVNPKNKATQKSSVKRSTSKGRNKSVKSNTGNMDHGSGNWVEPKTSVRKKRIQANAQSSGEWAPIQCGQASGQAGGHWYTGSGGRKVYVSKTGKESTGQAAYRMYKKESGKQPAKTRKGKAKK